jgi:high-affinity iron transporter
MVLLALACSPAPLPADAPDLVTAPASVTPAAPADLGAAVYAQHCAGCHGPTGKGDGPAAAALQPPPKDISRPRSEAERMPPSRVEIIRNGKPGTAMVGFATVLKTDELSAIEAYIHTLAHGAGGPGGGGPGHGGGPGGGSGAAE